MMLQIYLLVVWAYIPDIYMLFENLQSWPLRVPFFLGCLPFTFSRALARFREGRPDLFPSIKCSKKIFLPEMGWACYSLHFELFCSFWEVKNQN